MPTTLTVLLRALDSLQQLIDMAFAEPLAEIDARYQECAEGIGDARLALLEAFGPAHERAQYEALRQELFVHAAHFAGGTTTDKATLQRMADEADSAARLAVTHWRTKG